MLQLGGTGLSVGLPGAVMAEQGGGGGVVGGIAGMHGPGGGAQVEVEQDCAAALLRNGKVRAEAPTARAEAPARVKNLRRLALSMEASGVFIFLSFTWVGLAVSRHAPPHRAATGLSVAPGNAEQNSARDAERNKLFRPANSAPVNRWQSSEFTAKTRRHHVGTTWWPTHDHRLIACALRRIRRR